MSSRTDVLQGRWDAQPLGILCDILDFQRKPITKRDRVAGKYPYYGATGVLDFVSNYIFSEQLVLIGEDGAKWGSGDSTAFIVSGRFWVNNHAHVIRPRRDKVLDEWIVYCLNFMDLSRFVSGLTVPKLNQGKLKEIQIPLAPISEQRRIVAILDDAFERIDKAIANTEKNIANAKELFDVYVNSAFNGDTSWTNDTLGNIADFKNGLNFTKSSRGEVIDIVGVKDFQNNIYVPHEKLDSVQIEGSLDESYVLKNNDILTVRSNGNKQLIGRCMLVTHINKATSYSGFTIRIRLTSHDQIEPEYIVRYLKMSRIHSMLIKSGSGANINNLNQGTLAGVPVAYPDKKRQIEIIKAINCSEEYFSILDSNYSQKLTSLLALKQSLLAAAFSGELTADFNPDALEL